MGTSNRQTTFTKGVCANVYWTFQDITTAKESLIALTQEKKTAKCLQATNVGS
jgi:hypothetical protein